METRLQVHKNHFNKIRSNRSGPGNYLTLESLSNEEKELIFKDFLRRIGPENESTLKQSILYSEILGEWGVMCPHVLEFREYKSDRYFECFSCGAAVLC